VHLNKTQICFEKSVQALGDYYRSTPEQRKLMRGHFGLSAPSKAAQVKMLNTECY
jgi:hypothetical protein